MMSGGGGERERDSKRDRARVDYQNNGRGMFWTRKHLLDLGGKG